MIMEEMSTLRSSNKNNYEAVLASLRSMDKVILLKLFEDLQDIDLVQLIVDSGQQFILFQTKEFFKQQSEHAEAKQIDDARRYRDIRLDRKRSY